MTSRRTLHGFAVGPIEAIAGYEHPKGVGLKVVVGDAEVWIEATPGGRKAWVRVRHGAKTATEVTQTLWTSEPAETSRGSVKPW
jgi:hypothetical protein